MRENNSDKLGSMSIPKLFATLALPAITAQLINIVYTIVDRIYIGRLPNSELAMSALAISLPVITLITAFNMLLGTGGAPLVAMRLGRKDREGANKILTNAFVMLTVVGILLTVALLIFQQPLLYLFGAVDENIALAKDYVGIYALGTLFVMYAVGMNPYISTQGRATLAMSTVALGAVLNIILDPIFIFVFDMGVKGAALATIISQFASAVCVLMFFFKGKSEVKVKKKYIMPDMKIVAGILALGVSPFIMSATEAFLQISFNNQLSLYGGTLAVGSKAILASLHQVLLLTAMGMSQGAQPILSYNFGAGNFERTRAAFKFLLRCMMIFAVAFVGCLLLFPSFFAAMFTNDAMSIEFTSWAIRPFFMGGMFFGVQLACQQSFIALGEAKSSVAMAVFRKLVLLIPMIYLLPTLIGDSAFVTAMAQPVAHMVSDAGRVFAVLFSESISDILAATLTGIIFFRFYKKNLCAPKNSV